MGDFLRIIRLSKASLAGVSMCYLSGIFAAFGHLVLLTLLLSSGCSIFNPEENSHDLAFCCVTWEDNDQKIFLHKISGDVKKISNNPGDNYSPAWSTDGRYIAYTWEGTDIYLYDVKSDTAIKLSPSLEYHASSPVWTPDGQQIVFDYRDVPGTGKYYLYIMDKDGSNIRKLLEFRAEVYFYPDSYHFIYKPSMLDTDMDMGKQIFRGNIDGTQAELILDLNTIGKEYTNLYDFDPYSERLLLLIAPEDRATTILATYDIQSGEIDTLAISSEGLKSHVLLRPIYSKDYSSIAVIERDYADDYSNILLIRKGIRNTIVQVTDPDEWIDFHPMAFSPDGQYLAYGKSVDTSVNSVSWETYLMIVEIATGIEIMEVENTESPEWNPVF